MVSRIVVIIAVVVLMLSVPVEMLVGQKRPGDICRERCNKQYNSCVNSAYDWYDRCRRHNEELQCNEELRRMIRLCEQDLSWCLEGCD